LQEYIHKRGTRALIVEPSVKAIAPLISLLKLARYCEAEGHDYEYVRGKVKPKIQPTVIFSSCLFSYKSAHYEQLFQFYQRLFPGVPIVVGGSFPTSCPDFFKGMGVRPYRGMCKSIEQFIPKYDVKIRFQKGKKPYKRNNVILYSSKGCNNSCTSCTVPKLEGKLKCYRSIANTLKTAQDEIPQARSVILYDSNFTQHRFFSRIVAELREHELPIDIHGLHTESLTEKKAKELAKLKWKGQGENSTPYIRFGYDSLKQTENVERAVRLILKHEIRAFPFFYTLFNCRDSPKELVQRLQAAQDIRDRTGASVLYLFPQRWEPLNALERYQYVAPNWTPELLHSFTKFFTNQRGFLPITKTRRTLKAVENLLKEH